MTLAGLFDEIKAHPSSHAFTVAPISEHSGAYIGTDRLGRPCLFVTTTERCGEPPLRTAQVSLQLDQGYTVATIHGPPISRRFHSLCCEATDPSGIETFLVLVSAFLRHHETRELNGEALASFFRSLIRLFAVPLARDLSGERQGLWGELFVMRLVRGYTFWAPFWHTDPSRRFDFASEVCRVEAKTTVGGPRIHHFSHRQIYALPGEETVIASLILTEEESGLSLRQLIDECRASIYGTSHYLKLEKAVRRAGMEGTSETGPSFDLIEAERQLAWFRSTDTPHFRLPEPPGVSDTHYRVALSIAPRLQEQELEAWLDTWSESSPEVAPTQARR